MDRLRAAGTSVDVQASMALLLCFTLNMVGRGISDSYAVFLVALGDDSDWSRGQLTGVFSVSMLVFSASSPFAGVALEKFGHRALYLAGLCSLAVGLLVASTLTALWQVYVFVGVVGGIALSTLGMIPAASLLGVWYTRRLATAIGIAYTGLGCGSLVIVPAAQFLIETHGWRTAYRTLGALVAVIAAVVAFLPWQRISRRDVDLAHVAGMPRAAVLPDLARALRRPVFWALCAVFLFTSLAMYTVTIQVVAYLISIGLSPLQAASSLGLIGALSVGGMITSGWVASRIGFALTGVGSFAVTLTGLGLMVLLRHSPQSLALPAFITLFGIAQGTRGPLIATLTAREFRGRSAGAVFGIVTACGGLGGALGSWNAGWLYDLSGGYDASLCVAAVSVLFAATPFVVCREFRQR